MKTMNARFRGHSALVGAIVLGASMIMPISANAADWLDSIQDQRCAPEDIQGVSANVRNAIEASVRRAEMSIQAPTPVGDLGCLNDLMTIPLDVFSGIGGLLNDLQSGLANLDASALNIDIDVSGMICSYAAVKFAELTQPLSTLDKTIAGYAALAGSASSRLDGAANSAFVELADSIWSSDSGGNSRVSSGYTGVTGIVSTTDSSGYSGGIDSYVLPDVSASPSDIVPQTYDTNEFVETDNSAAWAEYNQRLMRALGDYIGCRVGRSLDGTRVTGSYYGSGYWDVPGSRCSFSPGAWPVSDSVGFESIPQSFADQAADAIIQQFEEVDRTGGQDRAAVPAAPTGNGGSGNSIWDQLGK